MTWHNTNTKNHPLVPQRRRGFRARYLALAVAVLGGGTLGYQLITDSHAAVPATQSGLVGAIQNVPGAAIYRYNTTDSQGTQMLFAKVLPSPAGGYLAVYATASAVKVASSTDLKNWTYRADLDSSATYSTVASDGAGGFVVAEVFNQGTYPNVKALHFASVGALYAGQSDHSYVLPRQLSGKCAEQGPGVLSASGSSSAQITLSYDPDSDCDTFRVGTGTLSNFSSWSVSKTTSVDKAVIAASSKPLNGNIDYRDSVNYGGVTYGLLDGQNSESNNGTWKLYLLNGGSAQMLNISTHHGSSSFSSPAVTVAKGPDNSTGLIVSMVVQSSGAGSGEAGELIYYVRTADAPKAAPAPAPAAAPTAKPSSSSTSSRYSSGGSSGGAINASGGNPENNELNVSSQNSGAYQGSNVNIQTSSSGNLDSNDIIASGGQTGDQQAATTDTTTKRPTGSAVTLVVFGTLFLAGLGLFLFIRIRQQRVGAGYTGYGDAFSLPEDEVDIFGSAEELGFGPTGYISPFANSANRQPAALSPRPQAPQRPGARPAASVNIPRPATVQPQTTRSAGSTNYQPPVR